jgi:predicted MFS family arabinose efflux permease
LARRDVRRLLLLGWLVPACAVAPEALAAPYVTDAGGSPAVVGWWLVALPVGMIVGDVVGVWVLTATRQRRLVGVFAAASFVPLLAFVWSPPIVLAIPLLVLSGLGAMYSLGLDSFVRDAVPEQEFGRTMAVNTAGLMTLQGLGFALAGASAELVGAPMAIALAGTCGLMVVALLRPTGAQQGAARMGHTPARVPAPERR